MITGTLEDTGGMRIEHVSKDFGPTRALQDVTVELTPGSVHALLGGNGSGKSTLIKILAGVEPADAGMVRLGDTSVDLRQMTPMTARECGLHFVHQQTSTFQSLTVAENLALSRGFDTSTLGRIPWGAIRENAVAVIDRFEIDAHPDQLLGELGPATQTMVAIARALQGQEDATRGVLVLDEPTASLPEPEVRLLLDALRRYAQAGQTIMYVTHRLDEVFAVADRATLLRDGQVVAEVAPSELTHEALVELIMGRSVEQVEPLRGVSDGKVVLEVTQLTGGPLRDVSFEAHAGEIVGVAGLIGSGRSSLLKGLFGAVPMDGTVAVEGARVRVSQPRDAVSAGLVYVPEDRAKDAAFRQLAVRENMTVSALSDYWTRGWLRQRREARDARGLLTKYHIKAISTEAPLATLSGGNQQKVVLARWLRTNPRVLLLDEPTQGVDVGARAEIYKMIRDAVTSGATALLASSDFEELAAICSRVLVLHRGRITDELRGEDVTSERVQRAVHATTEGAR